MAQNKANEKKRVNFMLMKETVYLIDKYGKENMLSRGQVVNLGMLAFFKNQELMNTIIKMKPVVNQEGNLEDSKTEC